MKKKTPFTQHGGENVSKERFAISNPGPSRARPGPRQSAEAPPTKHSCSQYCTRISKIIPSAQTSKIFLKTFCKEFIENSKQNCHCTMHTLFTECSVWDVQAWTYLKKSPLYIFLCRFGHRMAPFAPFANLATKWRYLHCLQVQSKVGTTCIVTLPGIALFSSSVGIFISQSHIKEVSTSCQSQ